MAEGKALSVAYHKRYSERAKKARMTRKAMADSAALSRITQAMLKRARAALRATDLWKAHKRDEKKRDSQRAVVYYKQRYWSDPAFRAYQCCRSRMKKFIKKQNKIRSSHKLIGCTNDELRSWIESQWESWMSWDNYGDAWHIDHIVPCKWFNQEDKFHQKLCWNFQNLRPLCSKENLKRKATGDGALSCLKQLIETPIVQELVAFVEDYRRRDAA